MAHVALEAEHHHLFEQLNAKLKKHWIKYCEYHRAKIFLASLDTREELKHLLGLWRVFRAVEDLFFKLSYPPDSPDSPDRMANLRRPPDLHSPPDLTMRYLLHPDTLEAYEIDGPACLAEIVRSYEHRQLLQFDSLYSPLNEREGEVLQWQDDEGNLHLKQGERTWVRLRTPALVRELRGKH
ncbi:uncharacterized protein BDZ99DRAFT_86537 [Mytilinidion resinicola]|uniref:Uncharacterized protein n=1 Tax=Mytilinidion resinicola TaxID=574789 RepID=A0A6A6YFN3_9PEZI|nr:uncharacterized protein BDZ99DRAFT_86537 [Mytilinidion resinicola]KAF2806855.1 hypothetical protein BDZ99DRAFT_86537 [Mytilinidion resinicola]